MDEVYRHPSLGFAIRPGGAWSVVEEEPDGAVLAVAAPDAPRPVLFTLVAEGLEPGWDAERFADAVLASQEEVLADGPRVVERSQGELDGLPAVYVVFEGAFPDREAAVVEQWHVVQERRGWMVSAHCPVVAYPQQVELIRRMAASMTLPPPADPPRRPARWGPDGTLHLSDDQLSAIGKVFDGETPPSEPFAELQAAGVLTGGALEPRVAEMLRVTRQAAFHLTFQRGDTVPGYAWWRDEQATLLLPAGSDYWELRLAGVDALPGLVADRLDLGPRPTVADRAPIDATADELDAALAAAPGEDPPEAAVSLADIAAHRRDHWRLQVRFLEDEGHYAWLEAIDAPGGWWLLWRRDGRATLEPADATRLWELLSQLAGARG